MNTHRNWHPSLLLPADRSANLFRCRLPPSSLPHPIKSLTVSYDSKLVVLLAPTFFFVSFRHPPPRSFATGRIAARAVASTQDEITQLFGQDSEIDRFWASRLETIDRPSAASLLRHLTPSNALGFESKGRQLKGSLLTEAIEWKKRHARKVLLVRVGEFYEAWGIDAVMLVQHAGLNPMGGRPRAGCPIRNVQMALDSLTSAGLSIAVYEEATDPDMTQGTATTRRKKNRFLAQVVTPSTKTYIYDFTLCKESIDYRECPPFVGLFVSATGITLVEIDVDTRTVRMTQRMTSEASRSRLCAQDLGGPVYVSGDALPWLDSLHTQRLPGTASSAEIFIEAMRSAISEELATDLEDLTLIKENGQPRPRSLYLSTASQIGLIDNPNVPALVPTLLPRAHAAHSKRFLQRWLLSPPPHAIADRMHSLCAALRELKAALPPLVALPVGKVVRLLSEKQGNAPLFHDVRGSLVAMRALLDPKGGSHSQSSYFEPVVAPLLDLVQYESGVHMSRDQLLCGAVEALRIIDDVVSENIVEGDDPTCDPTGRVSDAFFLRNEDPFRKTVKPTCASVISEYKTVSTSADDLLKKISHDFPPTAAITYDMINNLIMLKAKPSKKDAVKQVEYITPLDRFGKALPNRATSKRVEATLRSYLNSTLATTNAVRHALEKLCNDLLKHIPVIVQAAHFNMILQAIAGHVATACEKGWCLPELVPFEDNSNAPRSLTLTDLVPYWMSRSESTANSMKLRGLVILTAPNMSGKSTVMRSAMVAALLGNAGLHVPATFACIPRFDAFFLRTASFDVPSEGRSAFALEMDDVGMILKDCTQSSIVMVDELGRGTSARDGTALGAALLEEFDRIGFLSVFATHLHEILDLPVKLSGQEEYWRLGISRSGDGVPTFTHKLEHGKCMDSMAIHTARQHGIPEHILMRANRFKLDFDLLRGTPASTKDSNEVAETSRDHPSESRPDEAFSSASSRQNQNSLEQVASVLEECSGTEAITIPPGWAAPPFLAVQSCTYALQVPGSMSGPGGIYVGETDCLPQRLRQHRARPEGGDWLRASAVAVAMPNKSAARKAEALAIRHLRRLGYKLISSADADHVHFGVQSLPSRK